MLEIKSRPSPNHKARPSKDITAIIIHDTQSKTVESTLSWFEDKESSNALVLSLFRKELQQRGVSERTIDFIICGYHQNAYPAFRKRTLEH